MKPLSPSIVATFALPALPIAAMGLPIGVYLPPFYAGEMGLGLATVGTVFMLTRFWDVVTDPILGIVSDRWHTRWGRRKPWLVASVPIVMGSVMMIFMPSPPVTAAYLLGWMLVLYVGWTLLTLSHMSWGAELAPEYNERSRIQGYREVALILGMVLVLALPVAIERAAGGDVAATRIASMGWFVVILLPLTVALAVTLVPERPAHDAGHVAWRDTLSIVVRNAPLRRLLAADLLGGLSGGIVTSLFLFLAGDALKLAGASVLILVYLLAGVLFIPFLLRVSFRLGKHRSLALSSLFNAATIPFILLIPEGNLVAAVLCFVLLGVNVGAGPFLMRSIMADVADEDAVHSGSQRTGLFFSLLTMTNKIGSAVAVGIAYAALDVIGFVPGGENTTAAIAGLKAVYVWPACLLSIAVAAIVWAFPLDEARQRRNRQILDQRSAAAGA
ncbi:MAG: MFS transporter [Deltaproteobacteria bacterium]|nr:MFS transporter [Deltaproteobacteria bacterium]